MKIDNNIVVFEYFTASGEKNQSIVSEAKFLLSALLEDLKDFPINLVINKSYKYIAEPYENINLIIIDENIVDFLSKNAYKFNKAIFIAAENNNNLYKITKILEDSNVFIYNSNSQSVFNCSDKYRMYELLEDIVFQPQTFKLYIDSSRQWICDIKKIYDKWSINSDDNLKIIIKPSNGVDCEDIMIIEDIQDLNYCYDLENIFPFGSSIIVQEFIEGEDVSVSLIVKDQNAIALSLNKQFINIINNKATYIGGELPYKSPYGKDAIKTAIKACQHIKGLKGYVGVDLKITPQGQIYLLEINSRFTTPYIGLQKISDTNIAKYIIKTIENNKPLENKIQLSGCIEFKKNKNNLILIKELKIK